jgi:hypothetical protein
MPVLKTPALLKRWIAATGGDLPYPSSPDAISMELSLRLSEQDPELLQILSGNAPARLELAVMDGSLADVAATPAERQAAANAERVAELVAAQVGGRPGYYRELPNGEQEYVPPQPGSVTGLFELEALDPIAAQRERMQATVMPKGNGLSAEDAAWVQQEMMRARQESAEIAYGGGDF